MKKGVDIFTQDNGGRTALQAACYGGNSRIVELLIENGLNVNQQDRDGWSPLYIACERRNTEIKIIQVLI